MNFFPVNMVSQICNKVKRIQANVKRLPHKSCGKSGQEFLILMYRFE